VTFLLRKENLKESKRQKTSVPDPDPDPLQNVMDPEHCKKNEKKDLGRTRGGLVENKQDQKVLPVSISLILLNWSEGVVTFVH
jgi:hypothetical protein